eukprot:scaffold71619_cov95-Phaeocystis_antarctica.AAC.1
MWQAAKKAQGRQERGARQRRARRGARARRRAQRWAWRRHSGGCRCGRSLRRQAAAAAAAAAGAGHLPSREPSCEREA